MLKFEDMGQDVLLLLLLIIANGAPIVAYRLFGAKLDCPVDFGARARDGRRILGASKTWRGIIVAILSTAVAAMILGWSWQLGTLFGGLVMLGDLLSSFIKRRLGMPPSSMAFGLDQIPESLLPLAVLSAEFNLAWWRVIVLVLLFIMIELALSRILYKLRIRNRPY